jgi:ketosteroid isomerase-like protein
MESSDLDQVLEQYRLALGELTNGRPDLYKALYSRSVDVTLANPFAPFGPVSLGYAQVAETIEQAANNYRDGELVGFDTIAKCVTPDMAYIVELERFKARVGGRPEKASLTLRVTSIFRMENGAWKVVHRQADSIVAPRAAESVVGE